MATRAAEKGVGKDVDRERELRSGGTRETWRTCRNPGAPTRAVDPAGGNTELRRGPDRGVTPGTVPEAYGAGRLGGRVGGR